MTHCTDPACEGAIEDGYCDVCGMAPAASTWVVPAPLAAGGSAAAVAVVPGLGGRPAAAQPVTPPAAPNGAPSSADGDGGAGEPSGRAGSADPSAPSEASAPVPSLREAARMSRRTAPPPRPRATAVLADTPLVGTGPSSRGLLGLGMVQVPPVPYRDPATAVMSAPVVAEKNRFCGHCNEPVGRSRNGRPGRTEGYCGSCRTEFSFTPKLRRGDLVAGQYEVLGPLAHGGFGWVYLARDRNVNDRWVVLKGLLNSGDAEAHQTAAAERAVLAEVEHPNIVKIYNWVQHPDPRTGIPAGHIVLEYVGGKSLREVLLERRSRNGTDGLPVEQVIAYGLECLRAVHHLHAKGLLYCDFKPDNVIQCEEQVKLIDLGAVRRIDSQSRVYTTPGFGVPESELRALGPSVSSDLYAIARCMAVLSFRFDYARRYEHDLPPARSIPVLARNPSYDRLLRRALNPEPVLRFHDAAEMAEQLIGVLREVLSDKDGRPHPAPSALFGPERPLFSSGHLGGVIDEADRLLQRPAPAECAAGLPYPRVDPEDPAADQLANIAALGPEDLAATLSGDSDPTPESRLMLVRALIGLGRPDAAAAHLQELGTGSADHWRPFWYWAAIALAAGDHETARERFDELFDHLPGEAAPKLGLAAACEGQGAWEAAAGLYRTVWITDHSYVSAAFGLARIRLAQGDPAAAVRVLDMVPELSSVHIAAQMAAVSVLIGDRDPDDLDAAVFHDAEARLRRLGLHGDAGQRLKARVLHAALNWVLAGNTAHDGADLLGAPFTEDGLRRALERVYRERSRHAEDGVRRRALIDLANEVRPRTWL
ncbi:tetratricopeptide repeat protein [Streptomonospora nanhaiensis]|uniref:serine/threonine-protein kinase n=2 Tax=Streptomonospora nanhaiensis TaxID=1323731 RepID=UPI001C38525F|nr:serine/threonine-protein kinase [Streptomonospora nanhaiensis]MBV2365160.1 protein kinase [Streptomonospora nanhaiensis]MBV2366335.1 protein kinase [Streptomonospora nanhaiensis]MBX9391756.1 protein kinase [Streptomonospora nanhaiensis]